MEKKRSAKQNGQQQQQPQQKQNEKWEGMSGSDISISNAKSKSIFQPMSVGFKKNAAAKNCKE